MLTFVQHRRHRPLKIPINHFSHISSLIPKELNRSRASNVSKRHFIKRRLHVLHMIFFNEINLWVYSQPKTPDMRPEQRGSAGAHLENPIDNQ